MFTKERGDSLLEVVISTVIMGIIGVLMVSSIAVAKPFANKMSLVGQTVQTLNSMAESVNLQPFTPCDVTNPQPYSVAVPPSGSSVAPVGFAITNTELAPIMVSTNSRKYPYSAQLNVQNASGSVTWSVAPALPIGISLDAKTGLISGTTTQPVTNLYTFTADNGSTTASKQIPLTSALVTVLVNDGTTWVSCENSQASQIASATSDGTNTIYNYSGQQVNIGSSVTIWGSSNPDMNGSMIPVTDATSNTFTVPSSTAGSSTGGLVNLSSVANVQEVMVSTVVSGSPLHKVVTKAMP
jgi:Tfp pilus assembly protein PilV